MIEQLRYHPIQNQLWTSPARFKVVAAGRRSGKTEISKRKIILEALKGTDFPNPRFFCAAPTRDQAKEIYWEDLKSYIKPSIVKKISESKLSIKLMNNSSIYVLGLDVPSRIEGQPWDGGILDEIANMKPQTWPAHVRPALSDRKGWCWFVGVPEGEGDFFNVLYDKALRDTTGQWEAFSWYSEDILDAEEIAAAKNDLDELTYRQEYQAEFVSFSGRIYYGFSNKNIRKLKQFYDPEGDLIFCFDFNVSPGVAAVCQEFIYDEETFDTFTGVIGEVWIPKNSNTVLICERLIQDWKDHTGKIYAYGDATGESSGTSKIMGNDWDIIYKMGRTAWPGQFKLMVGSSNPRVKSRINSVNSRIKTVDGKRRLFVDPNTAPNTIRDFKGVRQLEGASTLTIDKKNATDLSHLTDSLGYYIFSEFPIDAKKVVGNEKIEGI